MSLLDTIKCSSRILNDISNNYDNIKTTLDKYSSKYSKVVIVGSGTSYNAGLTVKKMFEFEFKIKIELFYSNDFLNYTNLDLFEKNTLFVFISQGGVTKQVYNSLLIIKEKGWPHILITENINGPIASISDCTIDMGSQHEPYIFRTVGFDATCVTLIIIGSIISNWRKDVLLDDLQKAISNLDSIILIGENFYKENTGNLHSLKKFLFIGADNLAFIAKEADIKFMEMLPIFTNSFELEESIHGPQNAFDTETGFFILGRKEQEFKKIESIYSFISNEVTNNVWVVLNKDSEISVNLNAKSDYFDFLEFITFFQVLAYYLATANGRDLSKPVYPKLTNYINKHMEDK